MKILNELKKFHLVLLLRNFLNSHL